MARRVVITGLGTFNPLAMNVRGYWDGLCNGRSGIGPIELFDASAFKVRFGGEVKGFVPESVLDSKMGRRMDRFSQFAIALAVRGGIVPPTINYETPDPGCDLDFVPNTARDHWVNRALSTSFGFGGHNSCVAVGKFL